MSWKPEIPFEARFHDIFNRLYVISWGDSSESRSIADIRAFFM